jgi:hypothetical protein
MEQKNKRGRKPIPDNQKKKPLLIYLSDDQITLLGGPSAAKNILTDYSLFKIKQNAKKEIISNS